MPSTIFPMNTLNESLTIKIDSNAFSMLSVSMILGSGCDYMFKLNRFDPIIRERNGKFYVENQGTNGDISEISENLAILVVKLCDYFCTCFGHMDWEDEIINSDIIKVCGGTYTYDQNCHEVEYIRKMICKILDLLLEDNKQRIARHIRV